jgi:hypothetical protein
MVYCKDLEPLAFLDRSDWLLSGVGWLDADHDYVRGPVSEAFFAALVELLVDPWQPAACAGRMPCPFCRFTDGPGALYFRGSTVRMGANNLFVPHAATRGAYVAPSLIAHYVDAHEYAPPVAFQEAVLQCPPMRSMAYKKALLAAGIRPPFGGA